jgi:hypothetical protein
MVVLPITVRPSRSVRVTEMRDSPVHGTWTEPRGPERFAAWVRNLSTEAEAGDVELDKQHGVLLGLSSALMRWSNQPTIMQRSI